MVREDGKRDRGERRVEKTRPGDIGAIKANRCENHSTADNGIIPVAIHINIPALRPTIVSRGPRPALTSIDPITSTPGVAGIAIDPVARNPGLVDRVGIDVRSGFDAARRLGQIDDFGSLRVFPIA